MATVARAITQAKQEVLTESITRFGVHQIIQHAALALSFTALVITGLPMKFHDLAISQWWTMVWGGIQNMRTVHHFSAYVMVAVSVYHAAYLIYNLAILKKPFPVKMLPSIADFVNLGQEMLYFTGLSKVKPRYDRFNWREKFDYWAIFWGIPVMAGSGFVLMYPVFVTRYLPGWIVPASYIAHSDEAVLALTWIFLVHVFFNHFTPGLFPLNTSMFTGKVPVERYRREHPLEYNRIQEETKVKPEEGGPQ